MFEEKEILPRLKEIFAGDCSGHDYFHTMRVYKNALAIAESENCDKDVVALAALLHDADDYKLFKTENYANARAFLKDLGINDQIEQQVIAAIDSVSFSKNGSKVPATIEGKIVQDADRLDAIGAMGIGRCFAFSGSTGRIMYDPENDQMPTTIKHFYDKLLLLKDRLNTQKARQIATHRDAYMRQFLEEFYAEWNGER